MADRPIDRDKCRILISNDDGIGSPGIKLLEKIAAELSSDVWVVAPELEQSGASHSLTTRRPLRLQEVGRQNATQRMVFGHDRSLPPGLVHPVCAFEGTKAIPQ